MNQLRVVKSLNGGIGVVHGQYFSLYREVGSAFFLAGPDASLLGIAKYLGRLGWAAIGKDGSTFNKGDVNVSVWDTARPATNGVAADGAKGANIVLALSSFAISLPFFAQLTKTSAGTPTLVVAPADRAPLTVSPPRTGSVVDPKRRTFSAIFVEGSIAQAAEGKNVALVVEIEREVKNANKMMEIKGVAGQVIWKPYVDLDDLANQTAVFVKQDSCYTAAIAHGVMAVANDHNSWTGDVGIDGHDVPFTRWKDVFEKAARAVAPKVSVDLINCWSKEWEYADRIRKGLTPFIDYEAAKSRAGQ